MSRRTNHGWELCYMPALEMAEAIRKRETSCILLYRSSGCNFRKDRKINPKINAYCTVLTEEARQAAKEADEAMKKGNVLILFMEFLFQSKT